MQNYIERTLTYTDDKGNQKRISERDLANIREPVIVLGEPGMGKTWLLRRIAKRSGWAFRSAASFVAHPHPVTLVPSGARLVIDGVDEFSAAREFDPVNRVLGQLIAAGRPPFILSCRAADWRGAVAHQDISEEYGVSVREVSLEPLSRDGAIEFLKPLLGDARAAEVVHYLEEKAIPDLYGNPLTLGLFGELGANDGDLPKSRADLLLRASEIMWNERNDRHDKSPLSSLDQDTALAAAGAISAAFILTGSEAITLKPSRAAESRAIHAADLRSLPGGQHARTLVGSRLFAAIPDTDDQFKPIHRVVAEFLGARWLAQSAADDQARDRTLAMMTIDRGIPASLRGIHAWLARDNRFASKVVAADPYGVLRYGDADSLSVDQGRQLLHALKKLQQANPYFRAEDWGNHSAKGLTHVELLQDVRAILLADDTTLHLRTLLLGVIRGSQLAAALTTELQSIILNGRGSSFSFGERHDAAEAMLDLAESKIDWKAVVQQLIRMGDEDSTRLAIDMMRGLEFRGFSSDEIARAILAYLGLLERGDAPEPDQRSRSRSTSIGTLFVASQHIPDAQVAPVLDALAEHLPVGDPDVECRSRSELSSFVTRMVARQVETATPDPVTLLLWLRMMPGRRNYSNEDRQRIADFIQHAHQIRHAIQHQVMFVERTHAAIWRRVWGLSEVSGALGLSADDIIHFLNWLAGKSDPTSEDVEIWRELATFARRDDGRAGDILRAARPFASGNSELQAHLDDIEKPPPLADWQVERAARREKQEREKANAWAQHRKDFAENEKALRAGELRWIYPVSQAYLGLFNDTDQALPPPDRIGQWLGPELQEAALLGFEAVLTRPDIPSLQQIADSYAESRRWNFIYPLIAGVAQRLRVGRGVDDVAIDVVMAVEIALQNEHLGERISDHDITRCLEEILHRDPAIYERFVRLLIEPFLNRRQTYVPGLYSFLRSATDRELARRLSIEWLDRYADLPVEVEVELIDVVADSGEFAIFRDLHLRRAESGFADDKQRRNWEAVGLLADFDATAKALAPISRGERDLLWHIRDRMGGERGQERPMPKMAAPALAWVIRQFRPLWPKREQPSGVRSGNTNPWNASEFLSVLINRLSADPSGAAASELEALVADPEDGYTLSLRYAADQQRRTRREVNFPGVTLEQLKGVVENRAPSTTDDLLVVVRYAISRLQMELRGSDTDAIEKYWRDDGQPRDEDSCTDRLIEDIQRLLPPHGISRIPQRDMPNNKRADIVFTIGEAALPIECKGQWNSSLWSASGDQLDAFYLRDWRSQDRGIYLVYWFGPDVDPKYRLKVPSRAPRPTTSDELRQQLLEHIAPARRGSIVIEVLDLTR